MKSMMILVAMTALLTLSCAKNDDTETMTGEKRSTELMQAIDGIIKRNMSEYGIPGVIVGVWSDGYEPIIIADGLANIATGDSMKAEMSFRIGDISKTFVATAILKLIDEKKLGLDYKLSRFYPEFKYADSITIEQLLNETAGIHDIAFDRNFNGNFYANPYKKWDIEEYVEAAIEFKPEFKPGERRKESDAAYLILAAIAEKTYEKELYSIYKQEFYSEYKLKRTELPDSSGLQSPFANGYLKRDSLIENTTFINPSLLGAARGMTSNLRDLKKWAEALAAGKGLSPEAHALRTDFSKTGGSHGYGISKIGSFLGKSGQAPGFSVDMWSCPEKKTTIIVMANISDMKYPLSSTIFVEIANLLFPDLMKR